MTQFLSVVGVILPFHIIKLSIRMKYAMLIKKFNRVVINKNLSKLEMSLIHFIIRIFSLQFMQIFRTETRRKDQ